MLRRCPIRNGGLRRRNGRVTGRRSAVVAERGRRRRGWVRVRLRESFCRRWNETVELRLVGRQRPSATNGGRKAGNLVVGLSLLAPIPYDATRICRTSPRGHRITLKLHMLSLSAGWTTVVIIIRYRMSPRDKDDHVSDYHSVPSAVDGNVVSSVKAR